MEDIIQERRKKFNLSVWMISTIVIALLLAISIFTHGFGIKSITGATTSDIEAQVKDYIEKNLVEAGTTVEVSDLKEENGMYKVTISVAGQKFDSYVSEDGKLLFPQVIDMTKEIPTTTKVPTASVEDELEKVVDSTFLDTGDGICKDENEKPYVLLFSTTWCPHCKWIKDTFDGLVKESFASKYNIQHWDVDIGDDTLTSKSEKEVPKTLMNFYSKYNPSGSIPTFVFGCKYVRIGNGYESQDDLAAELEDFKLILNKIG